MSMYFKLNDEYMRVTWMSDFIQGLKYGQFTAKEAEASDAQDCQIPTAVKIVGFLIGMLRK